MVAVCYLPLPDGTSLDLNGWMVEQGLAVAYRQACGGLRRGGSSWSRLAVCCGGWPGAQWAAAACSRQDAELALGNELPLGSEADGGQPGASSSVPPALHWRYAVRCHVLQAVHR